MRRLLTSCMLFALAGQAMAQAPSTLVSLPRDTEIRLKMAQTLTSKHAYVGERVELVVAEDVTVGDALLVPKGTRVLGTVHFGKTKEGDKNNPHRVVIQIDYVRLGDRRILLSGMHSDKGTVKKGTVVASAILLGLSGVLIAMNSRTAEIKEGTEITAFVAEDVELPVIGPANKSAKEPAPNPGAR